MMEAQKKGYIKGIADKIAGMVKGKKKLELIIALVIIAIIVCIYISTLTPPETSESIEGESERGVNYSLDDETKLVKVLSSIEGAGTVEVMITYETTPEIVPAFDENKQVSTGDGDGGTSTENTSQSAVKVQNGNVQEPLVITEKLPKARGVIVVAEGAGDMMVRLNLQRAVHAVLDVPVKNVEVFVMEQ